MRRAGGVLDDEAVHLYQRGLYVEPLTEPFDPEKEPTNGNEYIYQVRIEEENIFPGQRRFYDCIPMFEINKGIDDCKPPSSVMEWRNKVASVFSNMCHKVNLEKQDLSNKFPQRNFPSVENEKDVCLFCLGSDAYQKIFNCDNVEKTDGNLPYFSTILHLSQEEIITVLKYMSEWFHKTGMRHDICKWIYSLLACLQKPLSDETEKFLEDIYDSCTRRIKNCPRNEKFQLHLISAILQNYFVVKAYTIGARLDQFIPLF